MSFLQHLFAIRLLKAQPQAVGSRSIVLTAKPWDVGSQCVSHTDPPGRQPVMQSHSFLIPFLPQLCSAEWGTGSSSPSACFTKITNSILSGRVSHSPWGGFWTSSVWLSELWTHRNFPKTGSWSPPPNNLETIHTMSDTYYFYSEVFCWAHLPSFDLTSSH